MSTLKKMRNYRHRSKRIGVDTMPLEDREVSFEIYSQYVEVDSEGKDVKSSDRD